MELKTTFSIADNAYCSAFPAYYSTHEWLFSFTHYATQLLCIYNGYCEE
jgi:hypothetical protein